jgi:hypothetical protein
LFQVLHKGWLTAVLPLMQQRWRGTNRLQQLVMKPLQCQQEQALAGPAGVPSERVSTSDAALAAASAGQWPLFMQLLEKQTGRREGGGKKVLRELQKQWAAVEKPDMTGLCGAVLSAWVAAAHQVTGRTQEERKVAVLSAVQAASEAASGL